MGGELLQIGDFGHIVFWITNRHYFNDEEGKLRYSSVKEVYDYEGVEIVDVDKSRIFIEGIDKNIDDEIFNIRRSQVVSFVKMEKPIIENHEQSDNIKGAPVAVASC